MEGTIIREDCDNEQVFELLQLIKTQNERLNSTFSPIDERE